MAAQARSRALPGQAGLPLGPMASTPWQVCEGAGGTRETLSLLLCQIPSIFPTHTKLLRRAVGGDNNVEIVLGRKDSVPSQCLKAV